MGSFEIDAKLKAFLEGGNSIVVATRDAQLRTTLTRATGLFVSDATHVWLILPVVTSVVAIENLKANREIAFSACHPPTYQTVLISGRCTDIQPLDEASWDATRRWLKSFTETNLDYGLTPAQIRNLWLEEALRVCVRIGRGHLQTPGPGAGGPLSATNWEGSARA
jgi:hypothetical protein